MIPPRRPFASALVASALGASLLGSQAAKSSNAGKPELSRPSLVGAAFDESRGRLVIVGGLADSAAGAHTWEWDGSDWRRIVADGPSPRDEPFLIYDSARRRIVLYGGDRRKDGPATDTWTWNGERWTLLAVDGPSPRAASMVYDARRDRIVLFGGGETNGALHNDTWEFDGAKWNRVIPDSVSTSPPARALAALAFDANRGRVVLIAGFAGFDAGRRQPNMLDDTWEWDGASWSRVNITGPGARDHAAAVYDPSRRAMVLYGGSTIQNGVPTLIGDTWAYDGRQWTRIATDGPPRGRHRLVFDIRAHAELLYGGWSPNRVQSTELSALADGRWTRVASP